MLEENGLPGRHWQQQPALVGEERVNGDTGLVIAAIVVEEHDAARRDVREQRVERRRRRQRRIQIDVQPGNLRRNTGGERLWNEALDEFEIPLKRCEIVL